jgi:hypothetical protein
VAPTARRRGQDGHLQGTCVYYISILVLQPVPPHRLALYFNY